MRILQATETDGSVLLRLEGTVRDQWVDELRHLSSELLQQPGTRLVLDLAEVSFIDTAGLDLLGELSARHVRLINCSLFVTQQIREAAAKGRRT